MKVFWDNNIIIDLLDPARPKHIIAQQLLSQLVIREYSIIASPLSMATSHFVLADFRKFKDAKDRLVSLRKYVRLSDMTEIQFDLAAAMNWNDFEDALQYQSAREAGCHYIITRDKKGFIKSEIPVFNPEEFLDELRINDAGEDRSKN